MTLPFMFKGRKSQHLFRVERLLHILFITYSMCLDHVNLLLNVIPRSLVACICSTATSFTYSLCFGLFVNIVFVPNTMLFVLAVLLLYTLNLFIVGYPCHRCLKFLI